MALIRKAFSTHSEEEARTCAMTAVQHIISKRLTVVDLEDLPRESRKTEARPPPRETPKRERYRPPTAPSRVSFGTSCMICGNPLPPGSEVFWSPVFKQATCAKCFEDEILAKGGMGS